MSELKAFTFGLGQYTEDGSPCVVAFDGEKNPRLASDEKFYLKSEADKVIAELQAENRKLKRALWLARAWGANQRTKYLDLFLTGRAHAIRKYKWIKITSKCRAKADEYK